ncbi:MAG: TonB family protein [Pseudomonadota bacterium]
MLHRLMLGLSACGLVALTASFAAEAKDKKDDAGESQFPADAAELDAATKLAPLRPWNIDFSDNRCRLSRLFGSEEEPHLIFFEQAAPRGRFGVTFAGAELERFKRTDDLALGAERDEPIERIDQYYHGDVTGIGPAIIIPDHSIGRFTTAGEGSDGTPRLTRAGIDLEEAATIERFVLKKGKKVVSFETGDMMPAFQALNVCTSDLLRSWGLDPEKHQAYRWPVWTNRVSVSQRIAREYPRGAINRRETGVFRMRVIVEEDGTISECFIEASTQNNQLDSPACLQMRRAKFEPARDAQGQPMRSFYATAISYALN